MWEELIVGSNWIANASGALLVNGEERLKVERADDGQLLVTVDVYSPAGKRQGVLRRNVWAFADDTYVVAIGPKSVIMTENATGAVLIDARITGENSAEIRTARFYTGGVLAVDIQPDGVAAMGGHFAGNSVDAGGGAISIDSAGLHAVPVLDLQPRTLTPRGSVFDGATIKLATLVDANGFLIDTKFTRCRIVGPAIIRGDRISLVGNHFGVPGFEQLAWPVDVDEPVRAGTVNMVGGGFYDCQFENIGLVLTLTDAARFTSGEGIS